MKQDPHFLRSRQSVARSSARKRRFRIMLIVGLLLIAAGAAAAYRTFQYFTAPERFMVREVTIEGAVFADPAEIRGRALEMMKGNMLMVDLHDVCRAVETIPWIREARARKVLPDTLQLNIVERTPTFYVIHDGQIMLADDTATLIDHLRPEHPHIGLPVVQGIDGLDEEVRAERLRFAAETLSTIKAQKPEWYARISEFNLFEPLRFSICLNDRKALIIVGDRDIVSRLAKYFAIEAALDQRYDGIEYIDVRFNKRLYVKATGG